MTPAIPDPKCVCGDRLSEHHQFEPGFCRECDCKEFELATGGTK